jgi:anti-anti-sigma factor
MTSGRDKAPENSICMVSSEVGECRKRTGERVSFKINEQLVTVILYCNGRICFREEARKFSKISLELLSQRKNLILELSRVKAMDSAGIGELVLVHMQAQAFECAVGMVAPTSTVRSLLELTNVASLFEIFPDVQTAIASLAAEVA